MLTERGEVANDFLPFEFNIFRNAALIVGSFVIGKVYQKLNQHLLFAGSLLVMGTCVFVAPFCERFWIFSVVMSLQGFFTSFIIVGKIEPNIFP